MECRTTDHQNKNPATPGDFPIDGKPNPVVRPRAKGNRPSFAFSTGGDNAIVTKKLPLCVIPHRHYIAVLSDGLGKNLRTAYLCAAH